MKLHSESIDNSLVRFERKLLFKEPYWSIVKCPSEPYYGPSFTKIDLFTIKHTIMYLSLRN